MISEQQLVKDYVLVVDYGVGNHLSVVNTLRFLGYRFRVSNRREDIEKAPSYILPGVGAFGEAVNNLKKLDLIGPLSEQVLGRKKPVLGICLGMQLFAQDSQEKGFHKGLGWIKGHIRALVPEDGIRVPHVGWNNIDVLKKDPLFTQVKDYPACYFDHSYYFDCREDAVAATCRYGEEIAAVVQKDNIVGVQFHPEKGQNNGLRLFRGYFNSINLKVTGYA